MVKNRTASIHRVAMLSVHTSPLALLGGKKTGGMNVYVRDFSRALSRQGIQVDVFTRSQDSRQSRIRHDQNGVRVIHVSAGPETAIPIDEIANYLDEFVEGVRHFTQAENACYDLIHSHYWLSGLVAERLRHDQDQDIPIVHMFHTLGHMKNRVASDESQRASQARLDGENRVIQVADRIVAATPAEVQQLVELYDADANKIAIIPPGVDLEHFRPIDKDVAKQHVGIDCSETNILFVGRIEPLKGIDTLLLAMAILQKRCPEVVEKTCVAIIGGDPWADDLDAEMARLQALRAELGIHDLVTFLGAKDHESLPNYYAAAEMVVIPSHYESFGMVALEAMAMGRPVIASEVGGLAYLVRDGETGFHVPSRDPRALAARIYELLTDKACRQQLGRQAQEYARRYGWPNIV
ncbi:MAG TPA: glycosyltransferase, partial [Anaerolineae bacterium]